jgi:hypothetical protein
VSSLGHVSLCEQLECSCTLRFGDLTVKFRGLRDSLPFELPAAVIFSVTVVGVTEGFHIELLRCSSAVLEYARAVLHVVFPDFYQREYREFPIPKA